MYAAFLEEMNCVNWPLLRVKWLCWDPCMLCDRCAVQSDSWSLKSKLYNCQCTFTECLGLSFTGVSSFWGLSWSHWALS